MKVDISGLCEQGPRAENEDKIGHWILAENKIALAVADGVGGLPGGKVASDFAVQQFYTILQDNSIVDMYNIILELQKKMISFQKQTIDFNHMATTFSAIIIEDYTAQVGHCGDTRISLARGKGIKKLTVEQSEAQRLLLSGRINKEQYDNYPRKNIIESALGMRGDISIQAQKVELQEGDRVFLTTDGVHNKIHLREMKDISDNCNNASQLRDKISHEMLARRPTDNYSFLCVFIG